ncbi:MAG TPA: glycosyltransferase family 9 protein [Ktedonobacteraceae bacterium]|nr:glycosyltransferase family 9 protein [Ktedonobacteraceae bacterium]
MKHVQSGVEEARLLITMPWGIGDAIVVGLSAVDQIRRDDPDGDVEIDILCNRVQSELLEEDPRIHRIIQVDKRLFPTNEAGTWKRGLFLPPETVKLLEYLRDQDYAAVLTFMFAPTFFYRLHTQVLFLNLKQVEQVISALKAYRDMPIQKIIRLSINKFFDMKATEPSAEETIPLYICPEHIQQARREIARIKEHAAIPPERSKLLLVAPDTSSEITRPPTHLLADGIGAALQQDQQLLVSILPGYTDKDAAERLLKALMPAFSGRISMMPAEPKHSLLELAALIDQSDVFITGDTSVMHLAAATKRIKQPIRKALAPANSVKIIALFGGTHPGLHGYCKRTIILGRGRKEQARFTPGVAKDLYHPKGKDLFDHIAPKQLTDAIMSHP